MVLQVQAKPLLQELWLWLYFARTFKALNHAADAKHAIRSKKIDAEMLLRLTVLLMAKWKKLESLSLSD
jgi:hypothetical protein